MGAGEQALWWILVVSPRKNLSEANHFSWTPQNCPQRGFWESCSSSLSTTCYTMFKPEALSFTLLKQYGAVWTRALPADCCLSSCKLYFFGFRKISSLTKQQKSTLNFYSPSIWNILKYYTNTNDVVFCSTVCISNMEQSTCVFSANEITELCKLLLTKVRLKHTYLCRSVSPGSKLLYPAIKEYSADSMPALAFC